VFDFEGNGIGNHSRCDHVRLMGMHDEFKSLPGRKRIPCTCISAFCTFFGRGLKAKMDGVDDDKSLI